MKTPVRAKLRFFGAAICKLGGGFLFFYKLNHLLPSLSFLKKPLLIGWLLVAAIEAQAAMYYVSPAGSDANNGTTWALAKQTIQAAINVATSGDTILVADGIYLLTSQIEISPGITVRSVNGAQSTTIDGGGWTRCAYLYPDAVLDGFTVTRGYSSISPGGPYGGGGVYAYGGTLRNCVISGNTATSYAGGVFNHYGTVENCTISGNSASSVGGGVYARGGTMRNCMISGNMGYSGGVCVWGGMVENCTISGNSAYYGGGVLAWDSMVRNCAISGNWASYEGGGVEVGDGTVESCTISGNSAGWFGGGIATGGSTVQNCTFSGNSAYRGGGVATYHNSTVRNCVIIRNMASHGGGGVEIIGGTMEKSTVENCTISGNTASYAGGVLVCYNYYGTVKNCIVYYNQNGDVSGPISYSCIGTGDIGGVGNITNEPQFVSTGTGYGTNFVPGNYRLQPTSPCINAGLNQSWMTDTTDLDGLPRILGGVVDMGAYECPGTNSAIMRNPAILYNQCDYGSNATGQTIQVWNAGMGAMAYALSPNVDWLSLLHASGMSTGETDLVSVNYESAGLAPGTYTGIVTITSAQAINSPQVVTVYLWVNEPGSAGMADIEVAEFKWVPKVMQKLEHPSVISFVLRNDGPADMKAPDTALEARFYLSSNMLFGDGDDIWVGTKQGVTLAAGEQMTVRYSGQAHNTDVTIPEGISGDYYVFVSVTHVLPSGLVDPDGAYAMRDGPITIGNRAVVNDYDGDGQSDMMVYDEISGEWAIQFSGSGEWVQFVFGGPGYETAPGDYDGDIKTDPAVHNKNGSQWYVMLSGTEYQTISFDFGGNGETKGVAEDYDGDGLADPGLYEEKSGRWSVRLPNFEHGNYEIASGVFGGPGWTPVAGDYDGDGRVDPAVYEEVTGNWLVMLSGQGYGVVSVAFGGSGYEPVTGDYDGDGRADPMVYHEATGEWVGLMSESGYAMKRFQGGGPGYVPIAGDYDGDGKSDIGVYNMEELRWSIRFSATGYI